MKNAYKVCGDKTIIYLNSKTNGPMETTISTEDLPRAKDLQGTWYACWNRPNDSFYVRGNITDSEGRRPVKFHRFILRVDDPKKHVDHINHNTLDNTRSNLNIVTQSENLQNKRIYKRNISGCSGVTWDKAKEKWYSCIRIDGIQKSLGYYSDLHEAIEARKTAEEIHYKYKRSITKGAN